MKRLDRNQALWLARGAALGTFLLRLLRTWRAGLDWRREIGSARRGLPKPP